MMDRGLQMAIADCKARMDGDTAKDGNSDIFYQSSGFDSEIYFDERRRSVDGRYEFGRSIRMQNWPKRTSCT
jgi:hypothetical protein